MKKKTAPIKKVAGKKVSVKTIRSEKSWVFKSTHAEAAVTVTGGQVAPVTFKLGAKKIQPFSVAPWAGEKDSTKLIPIIRALRGDFFCLPFGGNAAAYGKEKYPVHGETANANWKLESLSENKAASGIHLSLQTKIRPGRVDKKCFLVPGQTVIYSRHTVSGMKGKINPGLHAMLEFPDREGSGRISTSAFKYGQVFPGAFENPAQGGYQSLKPGAEFSSLDSVPMWNGGSADLTRYPARRGFEDLAIVFADPDLPFAWTAVAFPKEGYVFFTLKDPRALSATVFWITNGGRHYAPWSGRHVNRMGLEEVTAYFHYGIKESVEDNPISQKGLRTCVDMDPSKPYEANVIMGVAPIPADFEKVERIEKSAGGVTLIGANGKSVQTSLDLGFLQGKVPG
ncbi:MAG: hypothetical protein JNM63_17480 [Spirochaetia bacterium]|nr:hypothetical protein [Spirochaetia bacterium]